ncbi:MAG: hypothetical protein FVQ84_09350 [Planctomycetes bacterium]|nr:hypothetical protein [Planctomycetota bacterium]
MKKTISLTLVLVLALATEVAKADFTFGEPTNLGPNVNSKFEENGPSISTDGLTLYFISDLPGGTGGLDIWMTTRSSTDADWELAVNIGQPPNSQYSYWEPSISSDGLTLYFSGAHPGTYGTSLPGGLGGQGDIWMITRETVHDDWSERVNIGATVNSQHAIHPSISFDGLSLYFQTHRPGSIGAHCDIMVATRETTFESFGAPVFVENVNSSTGDWTPDISNDGRILFFSRIVVAGSVTDIWAATRKTKGGDFGELTKLPPQVNVPSRLNFSPNSSADGSTLYFVSNRPGGLGGNDLWQVSIEPVVDLNGDGIVDGADLSIIADHWGMDDSLCDIGPMPWGDGIVDVHDLKVLVDYLLSIETEEINVNIEDEGGQVELEQGQILVVTLESNPTTGYSWEQAENQEPILEQMGQPEFKQSLTGGRPVAGGSGWEIFRFKAVSAGQMTLQLVYHRAWEEGVEPVNTFSLNVVIH